MKKNCLNPYFCIKLVLLLSSILYLVAVSFSIFLKLNQIEVSDDKFNELSKCPLCYGKSLCSQIKTYQSVQIESNIIGDDTYLYNKIMNIKNVYFAKFRYSDRVVIKKLAHDDELSEFDSMEKSCLKNENSKCISKLLHTKYKFLTPHMFSSRIYDIEFGICFSDRLIDMIYKNYKEFITSDRRETDIMLLTTLKINPEPILLQMFPESDGWPFPKYYGACGRLIVESYKGPTLDYYLDRPFSLRAKIALSLLQTLKLLYENSLEISIYLMDLGYENISYDEEKQRIYFIDTENSLVADKQKIKDDNPKDWNSTYYISKFDVCENNGACLTYEPSQLCNNYHVDFNFYSACRNVLSSYASDPRNDRNFLHSIPKDIDDKYNLNALLNACAKNNDNHGIGRFAIIEKLIIILSNISK